MRCLSESERTSLLELARRAVVEAVSQGRLQEIPKEEIFEWRCGVFVTLHVQGVCAGVSG